VQEHTACGQAMIIRPTSVPERTSCRLARRAVTFVRTRWGVSDPGRSAPGTASGGWQRGSLTPHARSSFIRAASEAAKSAALIVGAGVSNYLFFNDLSWHVASGAVHGPRRHPFVVRRGEGEHCSRVCVPLFDPRLSRIVDADSHVLLGAQEVGALLPRDADPRRSERDRPSAW
jgi:hypothetical protein